LVFFTLLPIRNEMQTVRHLLLMTLILFNVSTHATSESLCHSCATFGFGLVCQYDGLRALSTAFANSFQNIRSPNQVDAYVKCQLGGLPDPKAATWAQEYEDNYRHYIKATASAFETPPQLLQCSLLLESRYNRNTKSSHRDAKGLCQITPITSRAVNQVLQGEPSPRSDSTPESTVLSHDEQLRGKWTQNFETLRSQGRYKNGVPTNFTTQGAGIPQNCIAAAGLYHRDIVSMLSPQFSAMSYEAVLKTNENPSPTAALDLMLIMAAAYNRGPTAIAKILKRLPPSADLATMRQVVRDNVPRETRNYMESMESCLTLGDTDAPIGWYKKGGMKPPTCESSSRDVHEGFDGTTLELWL